MSEAENRQITFERIKAVKDVYGSELMAMANVVGIGIGFRHQYGIKTDSLALVVMVERKLPETQLNPQDLIPSEIEGVPVDVQEVGKIQPQQA